MAAPLRPGPLHREHRPRVQAILEYTGLFRAEEISVALELFDAAVPDGAGEPPTADSMESRSPDGSYHFVGAFDPSRLAATPATAVTPAMAPAAARAAAAAAAAEPAQSSGEHLIGFACWGPTPGTDRTWDLYWIAVDPSSQGHGAGSLLMGEIESRLARDGARLLVVETSSRPDYGGTRRFYERRSYEEAARLESFYAPGDDRVIYVKALSQKPPRGGAAA